MPVPYIASVAQRNAAEQARELQAENARISQLSEEDRFLYERNKICEITNAPIATKSTLVQKYLTRIQIFSEGAAALGAGLTLGGPTAFVGAPLAAAGVSAAALASAAGYVVGLYSSSPEFKWQLKPILNLLCEFPVHRMRPAFEILFDLQNKLKTEKNQEEKQILIETAKLNLVVELVEATLEKKAEKKIGGVRQTRGRRSARHRCCSARKPAGTTRVRRGVARRRRTGKVLLGPRD